MISNIEKGNGFRGVCEYNSKGQLIGGNMCGQNARELSNEFGAVRSQNQQCTRPVFHVSLSAAPGEKLTDAEWNQAADSYMQKMGFDDNQYCVFRHTDTDCEHIHIVANRIRTGDLTVTHDGNDRYKSVEACREIEKEQGLQSGEKGISKQSDKGYCADLKRGIDQSVKDCKGDKEKFVGCCKANGIDAHLNAQSTGRIAGVSYSTPGGKEIKGSDLGHSYKYSGIEKRIERQNQDQNGGGGAGGKGGSGGSGSKKIARAAEKAVVGVEKLIKKELEDEL
jgi:hypothetical protein